VMTTEPALFWGLIASMWVGNAMLLALNLPLIGIWVRMIQVPYRYLFPMIAVFCAIGVFSLSNTAFDLYIMVAFGLFGYVLKKLGCEPAPMLFGFVLGAAMEEYLRRTLLISHGDPSVLITRPISATLLGVSALCLALILLPAFRKTRTEAV
jgi:putative tricarboxylic transport membrane protein